MVNASAVCSRHVFADCTANYIPALDDEVFEREVERVPFGACIYDALFYARIGYGARLVESRTAVERRRTRKRLCREIEIFTERGEVCQAFRAESRGGRAVQYSVNVDRVCA